MSDPACCRCVHWERVEERWGQCILRCIDSTSDYSCAGYVEASLENQASRLNREIVKLCKESFDDGVGTALDVVQELGFAFPGLEKVIQEAKAVLRSKARG